MVVFISHNTANKDIASQLGVMLTSRGIGVWFDEWEIQPGQSIPARIEQGLDTSTHFVLLWSREASESGWVAKERESAIMAAATRGEPLIIPVLIDDTPLPPLLAAIRGIRFQSVESLWHDVVAAIEGAAPDTSFTRSLTQLFWDTVTDGIGPGEPLAYKFCPHCGHGSLAGRTSTLHDETIYSLECEECGWSEWSQ